MYRAIVLILLFFLAGTFFTHNLTSINADIGRHIKLGEIIWESKEVPKTNLLSFTEPDYPFINHHWLSEVIFYKVYSLGTDWVSGLKAIIIFKVIILLATYFLLFLTIRKNNIFAVTIAFLVPIFVFSARTEPRPEIFSYLIFACYLFIIYKIKEDQNSKFNILNLKFSWLWFLPVLQMFWVNLHIYFIIGPVIYFFFLIDRILNKKKTISNPQILISKHPLILKIKKFKIFRSFGFWILDLFRNSRLEISIFALVILANFANPNFIDGATYPFRVLNNYGYSVAENAPLFHLSNYFGYWAPQDKLYLTSFFIISLSFILFFRAWYKNRIIFKNPKSKLILAGEKLNIFSLFDVFLLILTLGLSFKMQRSVSLYGLVLWPIVANNLSYFINSTSSYSINHSNFRMLRKLISQTALVLLLIIIIYLIFSGQYYKYINSDKIFGLKVSNSARDGINFIRENNIKGQVFNNFDIGSYLVWQLYPVRTNGSQGDPTSNGASPEQRVFIDGRPEAYPVEFFEKSYVLMQKDEKIWEKMSEYYDINYIFYAHTDGAEWVGQFLRNIYKNKQWSMVFLNDSIIIFLKNIEINRTIIEKHEITEKNIEEQVLKMLGEMNELDENAFINYGGILYNLGFYKASGLAFQSLIKNNPGNPYGYQGIGYAYLATKNQEFQKLAAINLEKAVDLGLGTFNNYFTLGVTYTNLGDFSAAEDNIKKALAINPNHRKANEILEIIKNKKSNE